MNNTTTPLLLSLVVPVYNEEDSLSLFVSAIEALAVLLPDVGIEVVFIDDGSTDRTLLNIHSLRPSGFAIKLVELTRNFGKEAALSAGLKICTGQVVVPMDVDLQDPPELIPAMISKWSEGFDVVLAARSSRASDGWAKRASATWFYRFHNWIAEPKIPENVGDFRLMSREVVDVINQLPESRRFMKGLFAWVGFRTAMIGYTRPERAAGYSKFNGWRLWNFALEGLTSFSISPLRIWSYLGGTVALAAFIFGLYIAAKVFFFGKEVPGYASVMVAVTFLGGMQLVGIGVLGEYLGRTYLESKRRPIYLIRKVYEIEPR